MAADGASGGILEGLLAPDVEAHAGVKLQRLAAWRGFRVAEHDPYLLTQLVRKDAEGVALVEDGRELAEGLAHQPGLHAHRGHAHLPVELGSGDQSCDRVDGDDVHGPRFGEDLSDRKGLLAAAWLRDQQVVQINAEVLGVLGIESMLGVDEDGEAPGLLGVGDHVKHQSGLARRFRSENFADPPARHASDAKGAVQRDGSCRDRLNRHSCLGVAQPHDAPSPMRLGDGADGDFQRRFAVVRRCRWTRVF